MRKGESQNKFRWEPSAKKEKKEAETDAGSSVLEPSQEQSQPALEPVGDVPKEVPEVESTSEASTDKADVHADAENEITSDEKAEPAQKSSASSTSLARMVRSEISIEEGLERKTPESVASQEKAAEILPEELAQIRDLVGTESDTDKNFSAALMSRKLDKAFRKEDGESASSSDESGELAVFDSSRAPQTEKVLRKTVNEKVSGFLLRNPAVTASVCLAAIVIPFALFGNHEAKPPKSSAPTSAEKVAPVPPNLNAKQLIAHAKANYAKNNKLTALNDLFAAQKLAPKDASVYVARGDYYFNEKKLASAADDYKKSLQLNPHVERAQKQLALCKSSMAASAAIRTKADKAPTLSKTALDEISSLDFDALRVKAYSALQSGKFDYAVVALSRCAQLRPNDALTRRYLAFALLSNNELDLAIKQFHAWSRVDSASLQDKLKFGRAVAAAEGADGSETTRQFFNNMVNDHASEPDVLYQIAKTCFDLGFYDEPTTKAVQIGLRTASNETSEKLSDLQSKMEEKRKANTQESAFKPLVKD